MRTPRQIAQEYAGVALVDALEEAIKDYGEDQYRKGHSTGYGKGSRDATIRTERGY